MAGITLDHKWFTNQGISPLVDLKRTPELPDESRSLGLRLWRLALIVSWLTPSQEGSFKFRGFHYTPELSNQRMWNHCTARTCLGVIWRKGEMKPSLDESVMST
jgi:hypothetical protein